MSTFSIYPPITAATVVVTMMNGYYMAGLWPYLPLYHESNKACHSHSLFCELQIRGESPSFALWQAHCQLLCAALSLTPATVAPYQLRFYRDSLTDN